MYILEYLSEFVIHLIFSAGVVGILAGFVLTFIPSINLYKLAVQVISIIVLTFGVYLEGGLANKKILELKILELEVKLKEAQLKSQEVNTVVQEKVVTKTKVVKEKAESIINYIDREVVKKEEVIKYIENCPLPKDIIDAHNAAATLNKVIQEGKK